MKYNKDDENYIYMVIGNNIKKARKEKGWLQEDLVNATDYSESFISKLEADNVLQTFSVETLWSISKAMDVDFLKLCDPHLDDNKDDTENNNEE